MGGLKAEMAGVKGGMREIASQVGALNMEVVSLTAQVRTGFAALGEQNEQIIAVLRQLSESNRQLVTHLTQRAQG